ncbi:SPFH domain-containing protein [Dactylosporangium sp. NPDC005555]|uniref:SPFH domain-containing protein n=1 Tax=Dactylosporangium sp. NPDC005555 TaxID=3154889 RepID=UPI0033B44C2A
MSSGNTYLEQVVAQQERLENDLRSKRSVAAPAAVAAQSAAAGGPSRGGGRQQTSQPTPNAVEVRVTGFGRWKTVIVPPNAFVVHTRRGRGEPLHVGLGVSFRYNPATDSYLVVPGAMQTILINAFCICRELQGVLVQAYVQWIIEDFSTAYRKLDFGDAEDPMRLVNLQLKEQAEAAIKDKVATLGVSDVLSDKQPIIEELTARLRAVAEGTSADASAGLGLRIVTVQIKEAVVSSARLWENLQKPYRSEQGRIARLAELAADEAIGTRELAASRLRQTQQIESDRELADLRARNAALQFDQEAGERLRRSQRQEEDSRALADLQDATTRHTTALERDRADEEAEIGRLRIAREAELRRLTVDGELAVEALRAQAVHEQGLLELERTRLRAGIDNTQSPESIQARLIDALPEIVSKLPKPAELRAVTIGGNDTSTVGGLLAELAGVVGALQATLRKP